MVSFHTLKDLLWILTAISLVCLIVWNTYRTDKILGLVLTIAYIAIVATGAARLVTINVSFIDKFVLGVLTSIALIVVAAVVIIGIWGLTPATLLMILSVPVVVSLFQFNKTHSKSMWKLRSLLLHEKLEKLGLREIGLHFVLFVTMLYAFIILVISKSSYVSPDVWAVLPSTFLFLYVVVSFLLLTAIFASKNNRELTRLCILFYAFLTNSILVLGTFMGPHGDPLYHIGIARLILKYGNINSAYAPYALPEAVAFYNSFQNRALPTLIALLAIITHYSPTDVGVILGPLIWSVFVPSFTYLIAYELTNSGLASFVASFLSIHSFYSIVYGSVTVSMNLGVVAFLGTLYSAILFVKNAASARKYFFLLVLFVLLAFLSNMLIGSLLLSTLSPLLYVIKKMNISSFCRLFLMICPLSFLILGSLGYLLWIYFPSLAVETGVFPGQVSLGKFGFEITKFRLLELVAGYTSFNTFISRFLLWVTLPLMAYLVWLPITVGRDNIRNKSEFIVLILLALLIDILGRAYSLFWMTLSDSTIFFDPARFFHLRDIIFAIAIPVGYVHLLRNRRVLIHVNVLGKPKKIFAL